MCGFAEAAERPEEPTFDQTYFQIELFPDKVLMDIKNSKSKFFGGYHFKVFIFYGF